jgi:mono/diheme cytochrome c family protein
MNSNSSSSIDSSSIDLQSDQTAARIFLRQMVALTALVLALVCMFAVMLEVAGHRPPTSFDPSNVPDEVMGISVDPAVGRSLYARSCASCHGREGLGMPEQGVPLVGSSFILTQRDPQLFSMVKVGRSASDRKTITGRAMPPRGGDHQLSEQDLADIVGFLRQLQAKLSQRS